MGMAASQARFLGLTARQANIEYEGQQINQARTTLANQSANLYNQMLTMKVPVPPNTEDFKTIVYAFSKPGSGEACRIAQLIPTSGTYTVQYTYETKETGYFTSDDPTKALQVKCTTAGSAWSVSTPEGSKVLNACGAGTPHAAAAAAIASTYTGVTATNILWVNYGTNEDPKYVYFDKTKLPQAANAESRANYYENGTYQTTKNENYTGVTIETTPDNRVSSLTLSAADGGFNLTCVTETKIDDRAYNDAMNQYTYENEVYQQKLNEINASIEIVQAEDRALELRLKQLNTEHTAIQTEMDAVSKVMEKNIESTFKTFG